MFSDGYLGMGAYTRLFENELKDFLTVADTNEPPLEIACVNTGTSALHLALQAVGVGPGDEVLVPTLTYVASFQAISATGARPVACDVSKATGCLNVADAEQRLTARTKAIMPVHYGSALGDLAGVYQLAQQHGLRVIEDAAHSFGGTVNGMPIGAQGDVVCFSFDSIKNITCGEGGAVVSRDAGVIERVQDLRLLGVVRDTEKRYQGRRSFDFDVVEQGWRYHMSNINAAIGRVQLRKIQAFAATRRLLFERYTQKLDISVGQPITLDIETSVPHPFIFFLSDDSLKRVGSRTHLMEKMRTYDVETGLHYKPNHLLSLYRAPQQLPLPVAEDLWQRMVTLPLHCHMTLQDVDTVCRVLHDCLAEGANK